jgi:acyl-CoA reductase-like NAD-dependent aldehyde dehydrogenase
MSVMAHDYGLFIGGEERPARSGAVTGVRSPATGEVIGHVAEAGEGDVADAVTAAVSAARGWAATARSQRAERLCHLAELVARSAGELAAIETSDAGRPVTAAKNVDLPLAGEVLTYFAGIAGKTEGRAAPVPGGFVGYSVREPFGVAAGILPWRCPLLQAVWKIAPALAAGNTVVVKPAEQAPLSPMALVRLAREAGIPPGVVNAVPGRGEVAGAALCRHPDVGVVSFTGSARAAAAVERAAAGRMAPVLAELGGKSAAVVFEDADVHAAVAAVHAATFTDQDQVCSAGSWLLVHRSLHDEVLGGLTSQIGDLTVLGDPADPTTTLGPLIDEEHLRAVRDYVDRAAGSGTVQLVAGGTSRRVGGLASDLFAEPTILDGVPAGSGIAQADVPGPVLCVTSFSSEEEAVTLANSVRHGAAASVHTRDVGRAHRVAGRLSARNVWINSWGSLGSVSPYGGYRLNGSDPDIMRALTREHWVWVSTR